MLVAKGAIWVMRGFFFFLNGRNNSMLQVKMTLQKGKMMTQDKEKNCLKNNLE